MTENVWEVQNRLGFLPTKNSEQTLSSIALLRNKNVTKTRLGSFMKIPFHKLSIDELVMSTAGTITMSNSGKKATIKLLKKDRDLNANNQGFHRLRLQTY